MFSYGSSADFDWLGQLAQAELGLDYYVARFYDPQTGHFTQADSIIPEPGKAYTRQVVNCSIVE